MELDHPCKQTCSGWKQGFEHGCEQVLKEIFGALWMHNSDDFEYRIQNAWLKDKVKPWSRKWIMKSQKSEDWIAGMRYASEIVGEVACWANKDDDPWTMKAHIQRRIREEIEAPVYDTKESPPPSKL